MDFNLAVMLRDAGTRALITTGGLTGEVRDHGVVVAALPLFHVFGLSSILNVCVDGLPKSATGKILKRELRPSGGGRYPAGP
jgi:acyl-CoA synthetase (AMP-forming)/AMP-acid ligase II